MDQLITLAIFGAVLAGAAIGGFFFIVGLAAFVYAWTNAFPWLKIVSQWSARPVNFIGLLILYLILVFLLIFSFFMFGATSGLVSYLFILIMLIVVALGYLVLFPLELAIVTYLIRLVSWLFVRYRGWVEGIWLSIRLQTIRTKIKMDSLKETGFKGKMEGFKDELSQEVKKAKDKFKKKE